jgi:hypothetical protein
MKLLQFKLLQMDKWAGMKEAWHLQESFDEYYYMAAVKFDLWVPKILGIDFRTLGLRFTVDAGDVWRRWSDGYPRCQQFIVRQLAEFCFTRTVDDTAWRYRCAYRSQW